MKAPILVPLLVAALAFTMLLATAVSINHDTVSAQGVKPAVKVEITSAPLRGRVVTKPIAQLSRFPQPILAHPTIVPPLQVGRSWHWHQNYGWVSLPTGTVQQILLPANYVLPPQVVAYEAEGAAPLQTTCPHCGQPIIISVR